MIVVGTAGRVVLDPDVIQNVKAWTLDTGSGDLDSSSFASSWRHSENGIREWSGSFECNRDITDSTQANVMEQLEIGGKALLHLYPNVDTGWSYAGIVVITGYAPSQSFDGLASLGFSFKGDGLLDKKSVL